MADGRLVLSDGSVLRCNAPGRPTLDVLLRDPTREDVLLKIWNSVGNAGIVGIFNARVGADGASGPVLSGETGPGDVPRLAGERFACFRHVEGTLEAIGGSERRSIELGERGYEVFTFVPIQRGFAAVGLAHLLNSHGAVVSTTWTDERSVAVSLRDGGPFVAYAARRPSAVELSGASIAFEYDQGSGALRVAVPRGGSPELRVRF
jgi:hypothetical protein